MPKTTMKTYEVTYSEDVSRYGEIEIEAASPQEAIEKAKAQDLAEVDFGIETSDPFRREILSIEDEDGVMIAERIPLDDFFTVSGEQERRLCECAPEMLAALKALTRAVSECPFNDCAFSAANVNARRVIAKAEGDAS